jgi:hypothetical protein
MGEGDGGLSARGMNSPKRGGRAVQVPPVQRDRIERGRGFDALRTVGCAACATILA